MESPVNEMKCCEICGNDDLEFVNGEVTCRMCGTQCVTQQTEVVLDETVQFRYLTQIAGPNQSALGSTIYEKKIGAQPWKLCEAFQIIFFAQLRAIHSQLDLSKDYFKMATQLWMRYLKVTGEAFLNEEERLANQYPHGWGLIYDPNHGANPNYSVLRRRPYQRKTVVDPQRQHGLLDSERALREMEFDDDDFPLSDSDSSSVSDLSAGDAGARAGPKKDEHLCWRGWCGAEVGRCHLLEFNLAVCFLPMLYLRPGGRPLGLADLLDLVRRHVELYQNSRLLLPAAFVVRDSAMSHYFCRSRTAPSRSCMVRVTRCLLDLLGMARLPRFPLLAHIARRSDQLLLPAAVAALARSLARAWLTDMQAALWEAGEADFKRSVDDCNLVCPDVVAMAFVLLTLFCLRGGSFVEAQRREASVLLLREVTGRTDLFLWTEWAPRVAKLRRLGKSVTSIEDSSDFVNLPNVGLLIQDMADDPEPDAEDEEEEEKRNKLGRCGGRLIQAHEKRLLIERESYVKQLMAPFQALIEGAMQREELEQAQRGEAPCDFKEHLLCYPVQPDTLALLLRDTAGASGASSPALFSQDATPEPDDARVTRIQQELDGLPSQQALGGQAVELLAADPPSDFREVAALCAHCISAKPAELWMTARNVQLSLKRIAALSGPGKTGRGAPNRKSSAIPLRWRPMFSAE